MNDRIHRVNALLEREIAEIVLRSFSFSGTLVTLTHVDATPNLIEAKAYISVLPEHEGSHVIATLNKAAYDIQQKINKKLKMRPIPRISFVQDEKIHEASRVEKLLNQLKNNEK